MKGLAYSDRTADRIYPPPEHPQLPNPVLFLDPESPSTRPLNLASSPLQLRDCHRLHSAILEGSAIS